MDNLLEQLNLDLQTCDNLAQLQQLQASYLGKKGKISLLVKELGLVAVEVRQLKGQQVNQLKRQALALFEARQVELAEQQVAAQLAQQAVDVTLPGRKRQPKRLHPITQARQRIEAYFYQLGFDIVDGPEIEAEEYNFDALNMAATHPARAMHDTFYLTTQQVLRTHTSPTQIRYMQQHTAPLRMIAPGRVYRRDTDATHTPMFHQVEGLLLDTAVTLSDLKGVLSDFLRYYFEQDNLATRFRSSYFPFTEPSAEMDISCILCQGNGCRVCGQTGWLEVLGCGMVHPYILIQGNIDAKRYQGFAFGLGIDRLAMLYYQIDDLRLMFENDLRFLKQF